MAACPSRQPCQATHTLPAESAAATGSISEPGSFESWSRVAGAPFWIARAKISKLARPTPPR